MHVIARVMDAGRTTPFRVCEVSCRARTERCPTVRRLGRPDGFAPAFLIPGPPLPLVCGIRRQQGLYAR
jgi:hypothetical protein